MSHPGPVHPAPGPARARAGTALLVLALHAGLAHLAHRAPPEAAQTPARRGPVPDPGRPQPAASQGRLTWLRLLPDDAGAGAARTPRRAADAVAAPPPPPPATAARQPATDRAQRAAAVSGRATVPQPITRPPTGAPGMPAPRPPEPVSAAITPEQPETRSEARPALRPAAPGPDASAAAKPPAPDAGGRSPNPPSAEMGGPHPPANASLNLALPQAASRPPAPAAAWAAQDPRAHGARPTRDERLAQALGTDDRLRLEPLAGGEMRVRQGRGCVQVAPARESQLNPWNQSAHPTPRQVQPC